LSGVTESRKDEADAWEAEQRELAQRSELFFACIQFCFTATRPGQKRTRRLRFDVGAGRAGAPCRSSG